MRHQQQPLARAIALACIAVTPAAQALDFDTGNPDVKLRWDNTVKYSVAARLKDPSPTLTSDVNTDDGDFNFRKNRLVSNRLDLLSEFDLRYKDAGMRLSGAAWYDQVYNRSNDNPGPNPPNATPHPNQLSVPFNEFPQATRRLHGRKAELLDAFVFGKAELGDMPVTGRLGKHTVLYGESLFFGNNGIVAAQTPVDVVKLLSVPNWTFKELMMPVGQASGQIQIRPDLSAGAYLQWRWKRNRIPGVGSYFSQIDALDAGGEQAIVGCPAGLPLPCSSPVPPFSPGVFPSLARGADMPARNSGQGGVQLRYRPEGQDVEFGLYAARFHSKDPIAYVTQYGAPPDLNFATGVVGKYQLVFPEGTTVFGASFSTSVGDTNLAGEVSFRRKQALVPQAARVILPDGVTPTSNNEFAPLGNTVHAQVSWIALLKPSALWQGGSFLGEIAWHRLQKVTANGTYTRGEILHAAPPLGGGPLNGLSTLDQNATRDATAIRVIFEPQYFQVLSGIDISVPIGIGYGISGRSPIMNPGFSVYHGGDFSIGLKADYLKVWKFGLSYTGFFGDAADGGVVTPPNLPPVQGQQAFSYAQGLKDRSFISFTLQHTF
ncbi:MAG TPA: DUF1302 domain-containing protein [Albitalea sp.]|uniref:DUF1302 domain-containing protein n=1 Tax=Piscinibacter sp. TaxID=1903157 RepID=UPI002ED58B86